MVLYIGNPKVATRKLLELNELGKVAGYKINAQNSLAFPYNNSHSSERKRNNPIYHCNKKNKIPRNKPTKGGKNLYSENYKPLMKEIKDDPKLIVR